MNTGAMRRTLEGFAVGKADLSRSRRNSQVCRVESYFADLVCGEDGFYLPTGETHEEKMKLPPVTIADDFSQSGNVAAIRAAQADEVRNS